MVQIKQLTFAEVENHKERLIEYLFICLTDNLQIATKGDAEKYYEKMKTYVADGSAIVLGALEEEILVGFQWAYEMNTLGNRRLHSSFDCIEPNFQGKKIGTNMMKFLEKIAKQRGICEIEAMCTAVNDKAVNYHLHNGFEIERYKVVKRLE